METINVMEIKNDNLNKWRQNLKSGDQVKVLRYEYMMPGVVVKSDIHDKTTRIKISGQNTPLWHDNYTIFPMYKLKEE